MTITETAVKDAADIGTILSKVEKLWRQANNAGATPAERQAFEAKALSLMEQHRITDAMLDLETVDVLGDHEYGKLPGRYATAQIDILNAAAQALDCRVWWRGSGNYRTVYVFGFKRDAQRVIGLCRMLIADAMSQAAQIKGWDNGDTFSRRRSFVIGFASAIGQRLREAAVLANKAVEESHGEEAAKGAALVLVSKREQMHQEYSKKRLRSVTFARAGSGGARQEGYNAGLTASLSTQSRVGGSRKALSA